MWCRSQAVTKRTSEIDRHNERNIYFLYRCPSAGGKVTESNSHSLYRTDGRTDDAPELDMETRTVFKACFPVSTLPRLRCSLVCLCLSVGPMICYAFGTPSDLFPLRHRTLCLSRTPSVRLFSSFSRFFSLAPFSFLALALVVFILLSLAELQVRSICRLEKPLFMLRWAPIVIIT